MKYCFKVTKLISESHERPLSLVESVGVRLTSFNVPKM